ncbi:TonB-dependent siderophore receptor [Chryseobacterium lactis]|uniref:TonB-dependent receptor n=1 Tax=Chryseobacterium lactis TaxID=1241981 RepID=A0A3G6RGU5_CHRLC|nr:TonB-dependent receptor [Chryseobacterium lactis]AZA83015.1 TonB-dependent receptor [Chryseobacterium lactis]AZB03398.1 TonB-dependent receptor [Chryseobacterium lactis]PNW12316.1 TonB-dependent siderophore receptor [Chryseobacterium lactis]
MKKQCAFIGLLASGLMFSQTTKDSITSKGIEDVVIVASRKPTKISEIPGTVWVVQKEKIQEQAKSGVPIKEMLSILIPSMDIGPQGRTNYGQNMRGRSALVMIDGVSLNSIRAISRQLDAIDPFNIERIEVLSGASSIYGGNATGGIINIITKTPSKKGISGETELGVRTGFMGKDDHDFRAAQSIAGKGEKFFGRLGIAYQQNGGAYGADEKQLFTDITQTDLQYNQSIDILATGGYQFNNKHKITASLQYYNSKFNGDRSLFLGQNLSAFTTKNASLLEMRDGFYSDKNVGTERYMGTVAYTGNGILGGQDLYVQFATRGEKLGFYPFPGNVTLQNSQKVAYMSSSQQDTYYSGIKALLSKSWRGLNVTYGADIDFERFEGNQSVYNIAKTMSSGGLINETQYRLGRYPTNNSQSYAGYVQAKYNIIPKLQINAGVRYQNITVKMDDFVGSEQQTQVAMGYLQSASAIPGGKSSYNVTLANAGLLYKINEQHQVWGTFSQGASLADPAKYYGIGKYAINGTNWDVVSSINVKDQPLQAIKTNQFEVGYRVNKGGLRAQIAGFLSSSDKSVTVDKKTFQILVNDLKLRNMGIEAEVSYSMNNGVYFGASGLLIKSEVDNNGEWKKQEIYNASPSKLVTYIGYNIQNWSFRFQSLQNFKLTDELNNVIDGYNTSDLMVGYRFHWGKFNLGIQNLFNTDYQTIWSKRSQVLYSSYGLPELFNYKGRGRTFNLSYTFDF